MKRKARIFIPFTSLLVLSFVIFLFMFQQSQTTYGFDETMNIYEKINEKKPIRYAVIGDSIGRGSGAEEPGQRWFKILERKMFAEHGIKMTGEYIVQSGATAFEGLYKLSQYRNSGKADIVFVIFGENDRKYMAADEFGTFYESLLRKAKAVFPNAEIMTVTESSLTFDDFAAEIERISAHYDATHIDMRPVFAKSGYSAKELTKDLVHPNGRGYRLYANAIYDKLMLHTTKHKDIAVVDQPLQDTIFDRFEMISSFQKEVGFIKKDGQFVSNKQGSYLETEFYGNALGVKLLRSPDGGAIKVYIDGKPVTAISTWWPFARERYLYVASGLSNDKHTVRFEVSDRRSRNDTTENSVVRISSVIVNKTHQ